MAEGPAITILVFPQPPSPFHPSPEGSGKSQMACLLTQPSWRTLICSCIRTQLVTKSWIIPKIVTTTQEGLKNNQLSLVHSDKILPQTHPSGVTEGKTCSVCHCFYCWESSFSVTTALPNVPTSLYEPSWAPFTHFIISVNDQMMLLLFFSTGTGPLQLLKEHLFPNDKASCEY